MKRLRFLLLLLPLVLASESRGQVAPPPARAVLQPAPPAAAGPRRTDEVIDLVYLAPTRPVLIRLHVWIDGKPYRVALDGFFEKAFRYFDRNGDGVLDKTELARTPDVSILTNLANGYLNYNDARVPMVKPEQVDADKDGKVTLTELSDYYRRGVQSTQMSMGFNGSAQTLTDALYKHIDKNGDGKLSREELAAAPARLRKLDEDDDDVVSLSELSPNPYGIYFGGGPIAMGGMGTPQDNTTAILLETPAAIKSVPDQLIRRYDKDKSKTLSATELIVGKEAFEALDADGNGQLDSEELSRWMKKPVDLELSTRLGTPSTSVVSKVLTEFTRSLNPNRGLEMVKGSKPAALASAVTRNGAMLTLTLRDATVDMTRNVNEQDVVSGVRMFFREQFRQADTDKSGTLDAKEVRSPSGQFFTAMHGLADRDGDGKLTETELYTMLDLAVQAPTCTVRIDVSDQGRALFPLLDGTNDSMLSLREWRTASDRLKAWDHNGDGVLAKDEVPRKVTLNVYQGQTGLPYNGVASFRIGIPQLPVAQKEGPKVPLWFTRMDRNGDGDVSTREFLGVEEEFARLDADGDGLISAEEARKADSRTKP